MFDQLHEDLRMEFSTAHCLPPLPPKSMPLEQMSRFVLSDEDDVDLSEEEFLRARLRGCVCHNPLASVHTSCPPESALGIVWLSGWRCWHRLQAYLNRLLSIPCVSWCKRFANFLEPDSGQMNVASEGMMTGVYGLLRSQFGMAVALLQQQYMEDPLWKHVFPDVEERRVGLEHFMMCYVEAGYYHGYAYVFGTTEHEVAGIALWMPPGTDITLMKMVKFGFGKLPLDTGAPQPPERIKAVPAALLRTRVGLSDADFLRTRADGRV